MLHGTINNETYITRTNLGGIPELALQVYEACLKERNTNTEQKIDRASILHGIAVIRVLDSDWGTVVA